MAAKMVFPPYEPGLPFARKPWWACNTVHRLSEFSDVPEHSLHLRVEHNICGSVSARSLVYAPRYCFREPLHGGACLRSISGFTAEEYGTGP